MLPFFPDVLQPATPIPTPPSSLPVFRLPVYTTPDLLAKDTDEEVQTINAGSLTWMEPCPTWTAEDQNELTDLKQEYRVL